MNRCIAIIILFCFLYCLHAQTQPVPSIHCVNIDGNNVTLIFTAEGTGPFYKYHLLYSYNNIDYNKLDTNILNTTTSYQYYENLAQTSQLFYYMFTVGPEGYSGNSDTIESIFLSINTLPNNSIASLSWNALYQDMTGAYDIYRKDQTGVWKLAGSTTNLFYYDTIAFPYCTDTLLTYKVVLTDNIYGCASSSNARSGYFSDGISPGEVEMDTVSVNADGNVLISWFRLPDKDIKSYIIYRRDTPGGTFPPIAEVPSDVNFYIDYSALANEKIISYRVAAIDSCENPPGPGGFDNPYNTLFLNNISFDYCDTSILLEWNPYTTLFPPVKYAVFEYSTNSQTSIFLGETQSTDFLHSADFIPGSTYCYFVRAFNESGKSSSSCIQCFFANRPDQPDTMSFLRASVNYITNSTIELNITTDTSAHKTTCILLRSESGYMNYDTVAIFPNLIDPHIDFIDQDVNPELSSYFYKAIILDECMNPALLPDFENKTILLQGFMSNDNINMLSWNAYECSTGDVVSYVLYRKIDGVVNRAFLLDPSSLSYDDDIASFANIGGRFTYLTEARVLPENSATGIDTVSCFSNEVLVTQLSGLHMPNAFTPNGDGINDVFAPVNYFPSLSADFLFIIYNRWGQRIFESTALSSAGWDGTLDGQPATPGVYIYYIRYTSPETPLVESKGLVTLMR